MKNEKVLSHEEMKSFFSQAYNDLYLKNRDAKTDEEWDQIIIYANRIRNKYDSPFVNGVINLLIDEMAREYTQKVKK